MINYIEIIIVVAVLSLVIASLKIAHGQSETQKAVSETMNQLTNQTIDSKAHGFASQSFDKFLTVMETCVHKVQYGNLDIVPTCNDFLYKFNKSMKRAFNESRAEVEKIVLH